MRMKLGIADPDPVFASEISAEFKLIKEVELIWSKNNWDDVESSARTALPDVVLFGPGWSKKRILSGFKKMLVNYPGLRGILVTADYSTELRRQAAEVGFTGVFGIPIDSSDLLLCLRRAAAAGKQRGSKEIKTSGRIITVFSTKGGVGKTVIATNLAVALASENNSRTILLDLDLQFGDVGGMLKLLPKHTLYDLVGLKNIDSGQINALLTKFNDRVSAFVAPLQPELADLVTPEIIKPVYGWLRQAADYVIVDTPPCFNDNVLSVLDETDQLYLVATLDLPSLKNIKLCLQTLKLLAFPREKTSLILNRIDRSLGLSPQDVEEVFQEKISVRIVNDPSVPLAVNKGAPVILDAPKAPASSALIKLSALVRDQDDNDKKRKKVKQSVSA